jgi:acyl-CoA reductase-like NAD-dependent aldehyde dehydrogenase
MIRTISPVDGSVVTERRCDTNDEIATKLHTAASAFHAHKRTPLGTRIEIANKFLAILTQNRDVLV